MKFHVSTILGLLSGSNAFLFQVPKSLQPKSSTSVEVLGYDSDVAYGNVEGGVSTGIGSPGRRMNEFNPFDNRRDERAISPLIGSGATWNRGSRRRQSLASEIWDMSPPVMVQGGSLKTWSFDSPMVDRIHVAMRTEGRPLDSSVELWQGPNNAPVKMKIYTENGDQRPFSAVIETPRGPNTIAVRNTATVEFPFAANVVANAFPDNAAAELYNSRSQYSPLIIQGGALRTIPFDPFVNSVQILLITDGRPLNAKIELLQGPNNNKQVVDIYTDDGMDRPFYIVIETPGSGNVVRIKNTATVEFPLTAWVEPYTTGEGNYDPYSSGGVNGRSYLDPVIGGSGPFTQGSFSQPFPRR